MVKITKQIAPAFENFIFDWDYEQYLCIGGYGSGKSYQIAFKIILKLLQEKRKCLVVRDVYDTIHESAYSLFMEILSDMNLLSAIIIAGGTNNQRLKETDKIKKPIVVPFKSPLSFYFPNGSRIIFRGMDRVDKLKSIQGISIIWIEEASEIKYEGYKELLGRMRTPSESMHLIMSCNPIGRDNWVYNRFFTNINDEGKETVILDENRFYEKKEIVVDGVYYHHSIPDDNPWLPVSYIKRLEEMRKYDYPLYIVARHGRFGATGTRVLPQIEIPRARPVFKDQIKALGEWNHYFGFDFGFEESYNAVISMAVDHTKKWLYIYDEIYMNKITDDKFALLPEMLKLRDKINRLNALGYNKMIIADNEDPKAIQYYRQCGFTIRGCKNKFAGSRISNTKKIKRFHKIIISPKCKNTLRELKDLTYKKDARGNVVYDQFNIDPHTFSAIWYALDMVTVADQKERTFNSRGGLGGIRLNGSKGAIKQHYTHDERRQQLQTYAWE